MRQTILTQGVILLLVGFAAGLTTLSARQSPPPVSPSTLRPLVEYEAERLQGVRILWSPEFKTVEPRLRARVRAALLFDIELLSRMIPAEAWRRLGDMTIAIAPNALAPGGGRRVAGLHQSAEFLKSVGLDVERVGVIDMYNINDYLNARAQAPMVIVHEITHRLTFRTPDIEPEVWKEVVAAYGAASKSGKYSSVPHILPLVDGKTRETYGMQDVHEYAAELSEAFWGRNDFYPFIREDLITFDPQGCQAVARLWATTCQPWPKPK